MKHLTFPILILSGILLAGAGFSTAKEIQGTVFYDLNKNSHFDPGEPGVEGVLVSNQLEVVRTDRRGAYSLPIMKDCIIFIVKPPGYHTPLKNKGLPDFFYIHQPGGSPELRYPGISPTGPLPERINFPLYKTTRRDTFETIIFADPQTRNQNEINYLRDDVISELVDTGAAFGIVLGDIMYDDLSLYEPYNQVIGQVGIPFYNVPGNHDMNYDARGDRYSLETFKRHYGPPYYAFEFGTVTFVVFDDVNYLGKNEKDQVIYRGQFGRKQLKWFENLLEFIPENRLIVMNMHIPIYTYMSQHGSVTVSDSDSLFKLLAGREHLLCLAGHMHIIEHQFLTAEQGWPGGRPLHQISCAAASGSWWNGPPDVRGIPIADQRDGVPNGYHIFRFEGNRYRQAYKAAQMAAEFQVKVSYPLQNVKLDSLADSLIVVNVFNGNSQTEVMYQINDSPKRTMTRTTRIDPYFSMIHKNFTQFYESWIKPIPSNHIWTSPFPPDLEKGIHTLKVQAIMSGGQIYRAESVFEVQ